MWSLAGTSELCTLRVQELCWQVRQLHESAVGCLGFSSLASCIKTYRSMERIWVASKEVPVITDYFQMHREVHLRGHTTLSFFTLSLPLTGCVTSPGQPHSRLGNILYCSYSSALQRPHTSPDKLLIKDQLSEQAHHPRTC